MKPSKLYALEPMERPGYIPDLEEHIPELEWNAGWVWDFFEGGIPEIELLVYAHKAHDYRRYHTLYAVKFSGEFVMICRNAGREGRDHCSRYVTNADAYVRMVKYIRSQLPVDYLGADRVSLEGDIPDIGQFYHEDLGPELEKRRGALKE